MYSTMWYIISQYVSTEWTICSNDMSFVTNLTHIDSSISRLYSHQFLLWAPKKCHSISNIHDNPFTIKTILSKRIALTFC